MTKPFSQACNDLPTYPPGCRYWRVSNWPSNRGGKLKPGMFASVRLPVNPSEEASFYVPKTAVISTIDQTYVQKIVGGKAMRVTVQKGDDTVGQTQ